MLPPFDSDALWALLGASAAPLPATAPCSRAAADDPDPLAAPCCLAECPSYALIPPPPVSRSLVPTAAAQPASDNEQTSRIARIRRLDPPPASALLQHFEDGLEFGPDLVKLSERDARK